MNTVELARDRFEVGWLFPDGAVLLVSDGGLGPFFPLSYDGDEPVWHPRSRAVAVAPTMVCPRCMEPSWALSRHCVERHGDTDVEALPPRPGATRPEWMKPDWI